VYETIALGEECSVIVLNKLLVKLKDPRSFSMPYLIGKVSINRTFCDLSSCMHLMPYSIFKRLSLVELRPATYSLQLEGRSVN